MQKNPFYRRGLRFSCTRCSSCCRLDPGYVFLSRQDLEALSRALGLQADAFARAWCRWVPAGGGEWRLSLREKPNYDCVFWREGGCSVYGSRPLQCRTFPFWHSSLASPDAWEEEARRCPGMGRGDLHGLEEIEGCLLARAREPPLVREGAGW